MQTIGRVDKIDIPDFQLIDVPVKIDTGANRSSIHCSEIEHRTVNGRDEIIFRISLDTSHGDTTFHSNDFFRKKIKSSSGHVEERYVVKATVIIFNRKIKTTFSLANRIEMQYPILLGRKLLESRFVVDVSKEDLSYQNKINEHSSTFQKS